MLDAAGELIDPLAVLLSLLAPMLPADVLGVVLLQAQNQGLGATSDSRNFYTVDIHNPGTSAVAHNLNLQDWL